jgi:hypothetical protein
MKRFGWLLIVAAFAGCDPSIKKFEVVPAQLQCGGKVTVAWEGNGDGVHLDADQPVVPALPAILPKKGTRDETVSATTEFTLYYPGAGHREKTVIVSQKDCGGGKPGGGNCGPQILTFTGTCFTSAQGPTYNTLNLGPAVAPGNLKDLLSDADIPVHVQHAGQDIALGAGGGPIFPLPVVPAAGDYTITIPGQVGQMVCAGAGPTSGTTEAPVIHVTVTPTCP